MNGTVQQEAVTSRLNYLAEKGRLTPQAVEKDARNPASPLHGCFEWDTEKAAYRFRIMQARKIITRYSVTVTSESRILQAPYAVRDPDRPSRSSGYVRTVELQTDTDRARSVLLDEIGKLDAQMRRVTALAAAFGLEQELDELRQRVDGIKQGLAA